MLLARTATTMVELVLVLFALERFHSAGLAGAVTFLALAPGLLMSPIVGALLDRHGRVKLMVVDYVVAAVRARAHRRARVRRTCSPRSRCSSSSR